VSKKNYHDAKWLRRELKRFGSLSVLCRAHGLSMATVVSYLHRHPEVKVQIADLLQAPRSLQGLALGNRTEQIRLATARRHKQTWSLEELREQKLPLYWNHEWLLEQLRELRSFEVLCKKHGYKPDTVQRYISRQPELSKAVYALREEMREARVPVFLHLPPALARKLDQVPQKQREVVIAAIRRAAQKQKEARGGSTR